MILPCATFEPEKEFIMSDNVGSKVSYFLAGLGIGALVGILFAPKSGEETREYLSQKADEGREYAQRKARELRERADDLVERSKTVASRQKESISAAVDAGREAYQREKAKAQ
jgi:gas vesicle protein